MKVLRMHRNRTEHLWILTESLEDNSFTTGTEKIIIYDTINVGL